MWLILLMVSGACSAEGAANAPPSAPTFEHHRQQGLEYKRRGRLELARVELTAASRMSGGETDFHTHIALARVFQQLHDIEGAFAMARRSLELAEAEEDARSARQMVSSLEALYGELVLQPGGAKLGPRRGYVRLEPRSPFIRTEKKVVVEAVRHRLRSVSVTLPMSLYLPEGDYEVNGVPVFVAAGDAAEIYVGLKDRLDDGVPWAWVVGGSALAVLPAVLVWMLLPDRPLGQSVEVGGQL